MNRELDDLRELLPLEPNLRLVKGAYLEPASVAYPKKADVDESFYRLSCRLLAEDARAAGGLLHMRERPDPALRVDSGIAQAGTPSTRRPRAARLDA